VRQAGAAGLIVLWEVISAPAREDADRSGWGRGDCLACAAWSIDNQPEPAPVARRPGSPSVGPQWALRRHPDAATSPAWAGEPLPGARRRPGRSFRRRCPYGASISCSPRPARARRPARVAAYFATAPLREEPRGGPGLGDASAGRSRGDGDHGPGSGDAAAGNARSEHTHEEMKHDHAHRARRAPPARYYPATAGGRAHATRTGTSVIDMPRTRRPLPTGTTA